MNPSQHDMITLVTLQNVLTSTGLLLVFLWPSIYYKHLFFCLCELKISSWVSTQLRVILMCAGCHVLIFVLPDLIAWEEQQSSRTKHLDRAIRWLTWFKLASYQYGVFGAQKSHNANSKGPVFKRCKIKSFNLQCALWPSWSALDEDEMQQPASSSVLVEKWCRENKSLALWNLSVASVSAGCRPCLLLSFPWEADVGLWVCSSFGPNQLRTLRPRDSTERDMPCMGRSHMARVCSSFPSLWGWADGPLLMTSSLLPFLHQCKYICLSALLAVIKEESRGAIRSR